MNFINSRSSDAPLPESYKSYYYYHYYYNCYFTLKFSLMQELHVVELIIK